MATCMSIIGPFISMIWFGHILNFPLRFVIAGEQLKNVIAPGSVEIFHFNEEYGLNDDLVNTVVLILWNQEIHVCDFRKIKKSSLAKNSIS